MYKIEDNGNNDESEEWAPVNQKQLNDEIEAEDQEQLDGALNPDAQIYELEENNEDGNVNEEKNGFGEVEEKRIKESEQKRNETRKQEEEKRKKKKKEEKKKKTKKKTINIKFT